MVNELFGKPSRKVCLHQIVTAVKADSGGLSKELVLFTSGSHTQYFI